MATADTAGTPVLCNRKPKALRSAYLTYGSVDTAPCDYNPRRSSSAVEDEVQAYSTNCTRTQKKLN